MYGPTEGTCGATIKRLSAGEPVTIGAPNKSTRLYILDRNQHLTPPGAIGEIYIAGIQVAKGYVGLPEENEKRFLKDTIVRPEERMYRTGDFGFWTAFGEVQYLGRNDRQIKLRGFRLDLNDLEIRIVRAFDQVTAIAIAHKGDSLAALIQPARLNTEEITERLSEIFPAHASLRYLRAVDSFPMTPTGKLDYRAVATMALPRKTEPPKIQNDALNGVLMKAWRETLSLDPATPIHGDSTFGSLGGQSITQLLLASRLSAFLGRRVPFKLITQSLTFNDLAQALTKLESTLCVQSNSSRGVTGRKGQVSPMEQEWFHKYESNLGSSAFNVSIAFALESCVVDIDRLESAWNAVMARHQILSSRYVRDQAGNVIRMISEVPPKIQRTRSLDLETEINRPFNLQSGDLIRASISDDQLVISISHIICDLTTLKTLSGEVQSLYNREALPCVQKSFMDLQWHQQASSSDLHFWSVTLDSALKPASAKEKSPCRQSYNGSSFMTGICVDTYRRLMSYSQTSGYTMHQIALGAVALALQTNMETTSILLGGPYLNRQADDLDTIGLFLEPLPIYIKYPSSTASHSPSSFMAAVQEASQLSLNHVVPWNQLLQHLGIQPDFPNHPLFDIMVTFHDDRNAPKSTIPGMERLVTWTDGSKFKLLFEFSAISTDVLLLRVEYDSECYPKEQVIELVELINHALKYMVAGLPYEEMKDSLRKRGKSVSSQTNHLKEVRLGTRFDML